MHYKWIVVGWEFMGHPLKWYTYQHLSSFSTIYTKRTQWKGFLVKETYIWQIFHGYWWVWVCAFSRDCRIHWPFLPLTRYKGLFGRFGKDSLFEVSLYNAEYLEAFLLMFLSCVEHTYEAFKMYMSWYILFIIVIIIAMRSWAHMACVAWPLLSFYIYSDTSYMWCIFVCMHNTRLRPKCGWYLRWTCISINLLVYCSAGISYINSEHCIHVTLHITRILVPIYTCPISMDTPPLLCTFSSDIFSTFIVFEGCALRFCLIHSDSMDFS